jgi:hypothetical protein
MLDVSALRRRGAAGGRPAQAPPGASFAGLGSSNHWLSTRMADPPKALLAVRPAESLQPVEPPPIPVAIPLVVLPLEEPEPDAPDPHHQLAAPSLDDEVSEPGIDPEPVEPAPVEPVWQAARPFAVERRGPRRFNGVALLMSGIGGAASVAAAVLAFDGYRQSWEPPVSHAAHVDVVEKAMVEQAAGDAAKFAEIVTAFGTGGLEMPGISATPAGTGAPDEARQPETREPDGAHEPDDGRKAEVTGVRRPEPRGEDAPRFSVAIPASPLMPGELSMPGTSLSFALPSIASGFEPDFEHVFEPADDTVEHNVSFSSMQLADAIAAEGATAAGVVVSDGQHGVPPAPPQGVDMAGAANDGDTVFLSLPAGTGAIDEASQLEDANEPDDARAAEVASVRAPEARAAEDAPRFSVAIPASPLMPGELSMPGTSLSYALPSIASAFEPEFEPQFEMTDDTVVSSVSFASMQLAEAVEAQGATAAGVVVSKGQRGIPPAPAQGSGTLVVEGLTAGMAGAANNGDTVVLSLPAGTRKVGARLNLVTPDGRLAHTSQLSVVVAPQPETRSKIAPFKASQRKAATSAAKSTKAPAPKTANGSTVQKLPPPPPAREPRGLFNFDAPLAAPQKANTAPGDAS